MGARPRPSRQHERFIVMVVGTAGQPQRIAAGRWGAASVGGRDRRTSVQREAASSDFLRNLGSTHRHTDVGRLRHHGQGSNDVGYPWRGGGRPRRRIWDLGASTGRASHYARTKIRTGRGPAVVRRFRRSSSHHEHGHQGHGPSPRHRLWSAPSGYLVPAKRHRFTWGFAWGKAWTPGSGLKLRSDHHYAGPRGAPIRP